MFWLTIILDIIIIDALIILLCNKDREFHDREIEEKRNIGIILKNNLI